MLIGIIGKGFVGSALGKLLEKRHHVVYYDKFKKECNNLYVLNGCEAIFICVPTPMKDNGEGDISIVEEAVRLCPDTHIIIKSTVPPGTTDWLAKKYRRSISFNPEFLRQKFADYDMQNPHKLVVSNKKVIEIYNGLIKCPTISTSNKTAEMIKYASNVMLAGQIGLANEFYNICKRFNIEYSIVKQGMLLDKRIGRNINVPGTDGKTGFGGACFPKDLNALIYESRKKGYFPKFLNELRRFIQ